MNRILSRIGQCNNNRAVLNRARVSPQQSAEGCHAFRDGQSTDLLKKAFETLLVCGHLQAAEDNSLVSEQTLIVRDEPR